MKKQMVKRKSQTAHYKSFGFPFGDPGGARTLDPLIKSQLLYQLSYGVIVCSIATAKVLLFSEPPTILAIFFEKMCFFHLNRPKNAYFCRRKTLQNDRYGEKI